MNSEEFSLEEVQASLESADGAAKGTATENTDLVSSLLNILEPEILKEILPKYDTTPLMFALYNSPPPPVIITLLEKPGVDLVRFSEPLPLPAFPVLKVDAGKEPAVFPASPVKTSPKA